LGKERDSVTQWLQDLDSVNLDLRQRALRNLGYAEDPRALPAVLKHLGTKYDELVRIAAVEALGRKGNYQAVAPLVAMLGEAKANVVQKVAESLGTIQLPNAMPALLTAIKKEKRDRVLGGLLRAAAKCQPSSADVRTACIKNLSGASGQMSANLLVAMGHLDTHDKIVAAVVPLLQQKNKDTRGLAVWALGNQRTPASLKALQNVQKDEKAPEVMKMLASALPQCRGEEVSGYASMYSTFFWTFGL
jgi:HEAT repeat protein